jgi:hypothetical protein
MSSLLAHVLRAIVTYADTCACGTICSEDMGSRAWSSKMRRFLPERNFERKPRVVPADAFPACEKILVSTLVISGYMDGPPAG